MATHASILAWRIPWTEEPGRLGNFHFQMGWSNNNNNKTLLREVDVHMASVPPQIGSGWQNVLLFSRPVVSDSLRPHGLQKYPSI